VRLEELTKGAIVRGIRPNVAVTIVDANPIGTDIVEITYRDGEGRLGSELIFRDREAAFEIVTVGRPWSFDGDPAAFRLVSEARRISLAHLFDPILAVHTSLVEPLPHQITAVYETMLPRQPLRFLLADDPGSGKTIMAGLLIKELLIRGDLKRCLIVCPGSHMAEQWQDELDQKFHLPFEIMTNDGINAARTNWFEENPLAICRLDKLSRNEDVQQMLQQVDYDLIVCDEAHKMSATFVGDEPKYTKRYRLGQVLSERTRHFLLMTATPHNGKDDDFQLFMRLLDGDRFEGRPRNGARIAGTSDMMRRLVKERLFTFDGTPLFPERIAYTVPYTLSVVEMDLYEKVTDYVRTEFDRAERLANEGRKGTVGFALTVLQRRLASSPEAIYQSLRRRRERLDALRKELLEHESETRIDPGVSLTITLDEIAEMDDFSEIDIEENEDEVADLASAASTIGDLEVEIDKLRQLEAAAQAVCDSGTDRKWDGLSRLFQGHEEMFDAHGHRRKLVIFTEHRDTLRYLKRKIEGLIKPEAIVCIQGGMDRKKRREAQEAFAQNLNVQVLLATDAAGEGINLQCSHLMVNYDLPWNPNRLEQRFGRIHRIGQTNVCHLWNLVAKGTREGDVYLRLLEKLNTERQALGGQVFDVLGGLTFENSSLRNLLLEAVRYGDRPDVLKRLVTVVENALNPDTLRALIEERSLAQDSMDTSRVWQMKETMGQADTRRLGPHFIASFFMEAFAQFRGEIKEHEPHRYEISVPPVIRRHDRAVGRGSSVRPAYKRITFEKGLISVPGKPLAEFVCPGHPLLDAIIGLVLKEHSDLLRRGTILIDPGDPSDQPRVMVYLEHVVQDARPNKAGNPREVSRRMQFVETNIQGTPKAVGYAPCLDYRPPTPEEKTLVSPLADAAWLSQELEAKVLAYAAVHLAREHFEEVRSRKEALATKTAAAVKDRLKKEIDQWSYRAKELEARERAGLGAKNQLNSELARARRRVADLTDRLARRLADLEQERTLSLQPPVIVGGALIIPAGLLAKLSHKGEPSA